MGITFNEDERSYLFSELNTQYQDYNYRSIEGPLLLGILHKLISINVDFTEQENRRCQYLIQLRQEALTRLTDPRLQHILQEQNNQGFGRDKGAQNHYFNSQRQHNLCSSINKKLMGN